MKISFVEISNFRKLESCRIDFGNQNTVLVGANNSGKTSAMSALLRFLKKRRLVLDDFTITNLPALNQIGQKIIAANPDDAVLSDDWDRVLPFVDVWLDVKSDELRYVGEIIPTLDWTEGLLGVRLVYEPKDQDKLYSAYASAYQMSHEGNAGLKLWPVDFVDFLGEKIGTYFTINAYPLDPARVVEPEQCGVANPQTLATEVTPFGFDPFKHIIRIDAITAQRGFEDADDREHHSVDSSLLSGQLRAYYDKQLDPEHQPSASDIKTLKELQGAKAVFDQQISKKFDKAMKELAKFGYPGKYNPKIIIETQTHTGEVLAHSTTVRYPLYSEGDHQYKLPEQNNGLGYQNLISMSFKLMSFRDSWINGDKHQGDEENDEVRVIPPIHLVLIEEPEAHLHTQVQQVFIKNAYDILRNHTQLRKKTQFSTQMVISTHSSYIALETDFTDLRYFRRIKNDKGLPVSVVANLKSVFGVGDKTSKFVTRYLKTTHCDLFFADAVVMVEGAAERMWLPHFIENNFKALDQAYISVLEINGRHSHRLRSLIEQLGITCLIITDIDTVVPKTKKSVMPQRGADQISTNDTINSWLPQKTLADDLWALDFASKEVCYPCNPNTSVRVAYQMPVKVKFADASEHEFIPTTFEDALIYENYELFKKLKGLGNIKRIRNILKNEDEEKIRKEVYKLIYGTVAKNGQRKKGLLDKAEFALELLFSKDPKAIEPPHYIVEALKWLQDILVANESCDFLSGDET